MPRHTCGQNFHTHTKTKKIIRIKFIVSEQRSEPVTSQRLSGWLSRLLEHSYTFDFFFTVVCVYTKGMCGNQQITCGSHLLLSQRGFGGLNLEQ